MKKKKQQTFQSDTDWFKSQKNVVTSWRSFALGMAMHIFEIEVSTSKVVTNAFFFFFLSFRVQGCRKINFSPSSVYSSVMNVFQTSCWKAYFETESL